MSEMMCTDATNDENDTAVTEDNTALGIMLRTSRLEACRRHSDHQPHQD